MKILPSLLAAVFGPFAAHAGQPLAVVSLTSVLADLAENVGGENVEVISIVKPGIDPHEFEPSPGDIQAITQGRVVLASGLGFEPYLDKLKATLSNANTLVIVGESSTSLLVKDHEHGHPTVRGENTTDPHWWHSIGNTKTAVRCIRDAFIVADPANKAAYEANAKAYLAQLDALSAWEQTQIAAIPRDKRILVTSHDALGYFARDNGFKVLPVEGISPTDQPSSKRVRELIGEIQASGVKAIFAENIENPKVMTEITRETGAKVGGILYADGLGEREASTYETMIRHNVTTIVEALR